MGGGVSRKALGRGLSELSLKEDESLLISRREWGALWEAELIGHRGSTSGTRNIPGGGSVLKGKGQDECTLGKSLPRAKFSTSLHLYTLPHGWPAGLETPKLK